MSKYPCGACSIGVKHKGILCTGICKQWYHVKCLKWPDQRFKKLTKSEIDQWKCNTCILVNHKPLPQNGNQACLIKTPIENNVIIEQLHDKITNYENGDQADLETSLTLAAEVGSALLTENNNFKKELLNINSKNADLESEIVQLKNLNLINQEKIEQLENEKETICSRNNNLCELLNEMEHQLEKEKQLRFELEKMFEEYDRDKDEIICKYEKIIKELKIEIKSLTKNKVSNKTGQETKTYNDMGTQTHNNEAYGTTTQTLFLTQLTEMRIRQEHMEQSVKALQEHTHKQCTYQPFIPELKIQNGTLKGNGMQVHTPTTLNKRAFNRHLATNTSNSVNKKKNLFSVSTQVPKTELRKHILQPRESYRKIDKTCSTKFGLLPNVSPRSKNHNVP